MLDDLYMNKNFYLMHVGTYIYLNIYLHNTDINIYIHICIYNKNGSTALLQLKTYMSLV
jgi:hypothetical protein